MQFTLCKTFTTDSETKEVPFPRVNKFKIHFGINKKSVDSLTKFIYV